MFDHIRSRIRIPPIILVPLLIGGFVLVYSLQRDTKHHQATALAAENQHADTEDAELRATLRSRFRALAAITPGAESTCSDSLDAVPVLQQSWIARLASDTSGRAASVAPPIQTLAFEQLASGAPIAAPARLRRNQRLQALAVAPRVALVIVTAATPIVESPGEPGKSRFSAGSLDGQLAIVELPGAKVLCRAAIQFETPAFTSYAATGSSADNSLVIEDAWREPFWKAINAALDRIDDFRAKALRD